MEATTTADFKKVIFQTCNELKGTQTEATAAVDFQHKVHLTDFLWINPNTEATTTVDLNTIWFAECRVNEEKPQTEATTAVDCKNYSEWHTP